VPLVAKTLLDLSPAELGFFMGTITAGFAVGSFLSGRYSVRLGLDFMVIAGRVVACAGLSIGILWLLFGHINVFSIFGSTIFVGVGNGLSMPNASSGAMSSVRSDLAGSAAGLTGALTVAGGAALTFAGSVLIQSTVVPQHCSD
jgi:MFS transporter, DHA1 family, multidrug resistance protein